MKKQYEHKYSCPNCGEKMIKDPKTGQFVFTCMECETDWFIIQCA